VRRTAFETAVHLGTRAGYVALTALDAAGAELGTTAVRRF
jgi:hypothetical protein